MARFMGIVKDDISDDSSNMNFDGKLNYHRFLNEGIKEQN